MAGTPCMVVSALQGRFQQPHGLHTVVTVTVNAIQRTVPNTHGTHAHVKLLSAYICGLQQLTVCYDLLQPLPYNQDY